MKLSIRNLHGNIMKTDDFQGSLDFFYDRHLDFFPDRMV
jgi:hypothetical protein